MSCYLASKEPDMTDAPLSDVTLREQLAHIDQLLEDAARKRQERQLAPLQLLFTGLGAGAALFAAGGAFFKVLGV